MKLRVLRGRYQYVLGVLLFGLAFVWGYLGAPPMSSVSVEWMRSEREAYAPSYSAEGGPELAFIYIGSSGCAYSNGPELPVMIEQLKQRIKEEAQSTDRSFAAIGVAKDWVVEDGIEHLQKFGAFDEVMTGRNWLNVGALKYMWEDIPGKAATPQIVVVDRVVEGVDAPAYGIKEEELVVRKIGLREIRQWLEQGVPVPPLDPVAMATE